LVALLPTTLYKIMRYLPWEGLDAESQATYGSRDAWQKAMNKMEQEWLNPSGNSRGNPKIGGMLSDKTGKPNNAMPDWIKAPDPFSPVTQATQQHTNPITGETWTSNTGGYSVKPNLDQGKYVGNPNQGDWYNDHTGMPSLYIGEKSLPSMGGGNGMQQPPGIVDTSWKGPPAPGLVGGTIASWDGYSQDPTFKGYWDSEFYTPNRNNNWQGNETPWSGYYDGMEVSGGSPTERGYFHQYLDSIGRSDLYAKPENVTPNPGQKYVEGDNTDVYKAQIGNPNTPAPIEETQEEKNTKYLNYQQEQMMSNAGKSGYTDDGRFVGKYGFIKDPTAGLNSTSKDYFNSATGESFSGAGWTVPEAMQVGNWFEVGKKPDDWQEQTQLQDGNWYGADNLQENADRLYSEQYPDSKTADKYRTKYTPEPTRINKGIGQINNGLIQMTSDDSALDGPAPYMFNTDTGSITQASGRGGLGGGTWNAGDEGYQQLMDNYQQNNPNAQSLAINQPAPDFNMSPAVLPTENINPFADIPMWQGFPTQQQPTYTQPAYTQPTSDGTTSGMPNLGYASSQLAGTSPAGLEKQNLDYAMAQLGMMTGGYGRGYTQPGDFGTPTNPQAGVTYGGGDGETGNFGSSSDNYRSPQDYQDYLTGDRSFLQGALGLFGPLGTGLGIATDYDMGFSTLSPNTGENLGYTNPFTDEYSAFYNENYAGPGSDMAFTQDLMYPTEQRDMLINQQSFDILPEQTEESFTDWLGGMFGGNTLNYDPDMDLERSDWSDTTPAAPGSFDNRLQGPWSGTDTYKNSLEGYANAEQINKDFNEMLNWEDTDPQSVQEFTKMFSSLNNLTEAEFNKLALEGLKKDEEKKIADVLAKEQTRQEAITDIKSSLSNLGSVMTEQKEWTATQFEDYQGAMDFQIDNIKETLSSQLSLNEAQRSILRDAMMEMTSNSVQSINAQLMSISDTNSKQYNDLLSKLETVEGDLTQQIEDAYTGPNTGYNPITDTAPDTGGTSPEDLGGTSTTDEDAFAEIDSGYDDPSESSGPSDSGSSDSGQHDSSGGSISNDSFDNDDDAGGWSW